MKKQAYTKPAVWVVRIQQRCHLLNMSDGKNVYGKTVSGEYQMSRQSSDWDDDE